MELLEKKRRVSIQLISPASEENRDNQQEIRMLDVVSIQLISPASEE